MRRILTWLVWLPLILVVVALGVANRHPLTLSWNPFEPSSVVDGIQVPVFVGLLAAFAFGSIAGGFIVWNTQRKYRRAYREERRKAERLTGDVQRMKAEAAAPPPAAGVAALPVPR